MIENGVLLRGINSCSSSVLNGLVLIFIKSNIRNGLGLRHILGLDYYIYELPECNGIKNYCHS